MALPAVDSDEEAIQFSLKEMTKSVETALLGISHFSQKIKSTLLRREKVDLINSVISVHGKESPEVFFFGTLLIREWLLSIEKGLNESSSGASMDPVVLDGVLHASIQTCVNAINFFRSKSNGDSSLVHVSFSLLHTAASLKLNVPLEQGTPSSKITGNLLQGFSDLLSPIDFLSALDEETVGIVLAGACVLAQLHGQKGELMFVRKDVANFCLDFVQNYDRADSSRLLYSVMYLSLAISTPTEMKDYFVSKVFMKTSLLMKKLCLLLPSYVNQKLLLLTVIRFASQILSNGLQILAIEANQTEEEEGGGFFQGMFGGSERARLPAVFDSIDIESLDDIFSAYAQGDTDSDISILVALAATGESLLQYYGTSNSSRANSVSTTVKKWALAFLTSDNAIVNACGLTLVTDLRQYTGEPITGILPVSVFKDCVECLYRFSPARAKEECFEFLRRIAVAAPEAEQECMGYLEVFISRFNFHHLMMYNELLKKLFFKTITMKDAFGRLLKALRFSSSSSLTYDQIFVIARVLMQMTLAVQAKGSIQDFKTELARTESERLTATASTGSSILVALMRGIQICLVKGKRDMETAEIIVALIQELVPNRSPTFDQLILSLFKEEPDSIGRIESILRSEDIKPKSLPDLSLGDSAPADQSSTVVAAFISKGLLYYKFPSRNEKKKNRVGEKDTVSAPPPNKEKAGEEGWMDSAANWFIDFTGNESEEETPAEENHQIAKKKEKKKVKSGESDDKDESPEEEVAVSTKPPALAPKKTVTATSSIAPLAEEAPEKKIKKKKKEDVGTLGDYVDTAALYTAFGGGLGGETSPPEESKDNNTNSRSKKDKNPSVEEPKGSISNKALPPKKGAGAPPPSLGKKAASGAPPPPSSKKGAAMPPPVVKKAASGASPPSLSKKAAPGAPPSSLGKKGTVSRPVIKN